MRSDPESLSCSNADGFVKRNGESIPLDQASGLHIDIEDIEVVAGPTRDELPVLGMARSRPAFVTEGRSSVDS